MFFTFSQIIFVFYYRLKKVQYCEAQKRQDTAREDIDDVKIEKVTHNKSLEDVSSEIQKRFSDHMLLR